MCSLHTQFLQHICKNILWHTQLCFKILHRGATAIGSLHIRFLQHKKKKKNTVTYPTIGFLKPSLCVDSCISAANLACGLNKYLRNCPTHQTIGDPWSLMRRGAMSSGIAKGIYGGRGARLSANGNFATWTSSTASGAAIEMSILCKHFQIDLKLTNYYYEYLTKSTSLTEEIILIWWLSGPQK